MFMALAPTARPQLGSYGPSAWVRRLLKLLLLLGAAFLISAAIISAAYGLACAVTPSTPLTRIDAPASSANYAVDDAQGIGAFARLRLKAGER